MNETVVWKLLQSYFSNEKAAANIQLESFNEYITTGIPRIFDEEPEITVYPKKNQKYIVRFGQVYIPKVSIIEEDRLIKEIYPDDARKRDLNYETNVFVDIYTQLLESKNNSDDYEVIESESFPHVLFAKIPVMVGSVKCNLYGKTKDELISLGEATEDPFGYFIIGGKERVIVAQERINYNQVYVFEQKSSSKWKSVAEMRSMSEETGHSILIKGMIDEEEKIFFSLPYIQQEIPIAIVFKALGFNEFEKFISPTKEMKYLIKNAIKEGYVVKDQEEALKYIGEHSIHIISKDKQLPYSVQVLENELFPHLGVYSTTLERCYVLGHIIKKLLLTFLNKRPLDDRDNISNKRIETTGILFNELFRLHLKKLVKLAHHFLVKRPNIMILLPKINTITQGIRYSCATGNWGVQKNAWIRNGVSQILNRLTFSATLSHLRRVVIPIGKEGKNQKIRQIHPSQMMFICLHETPEGMCLTGDTEISLINDETKKIKDMTEKDVVISVNPETKELKHSSIFNFFETASDNLYEIKTISGRTIRSTGHHPHFVNDQWLNTEDISIGDILYVKSETSSKFDDDPIESITKIPNETVYDFTTEDENHSFIANGILTHNCCGTNKNFTIMTRVSNKTSSIVLREILDKSKYLKSLDDEDNSIVVFINGIPVGFVKKDELDLFMSQLKNWRQNSIIHSMVSITYDRVDDEVKLFCDEGRMLRPLIKITDGQIPDITDDWDEMISAGTILYLDSNEIEEAYIALTPEEINDKHHYLEIHPSLMNGIGLSPMPFPDHTQAPRCSYLTNQTKQAIGTFATSYRNRVDTTAHVLHYGQKPLVNTKMAEFLKIGEIPYGVNAIVAVAPFYGWISPMSNGNIQASRNCIRQHFQIAGKSLKMIL